jgi:hypothetical protein
MGMMGLLEGERGKQVRLTVFDNEPMARLAEQRLRQAGIPCYTRSLGVGPGATGSAFYQPCALYVYQADATRAREILKLAPAETGHREELGAPRSRRLALTLAAAAIIAAWLAAGAIAFLAVRLTG